MTNRRSRGFTLVELLVVIAIIGILVGLLLPAVQAARQAARRMSCSSNSHNLAIALHNYHDSNRGFPPGSRLEIGSNSAWGMFALVLPYLEQQALYESIDLVASQPDPCLYIRDLQNNGLPNPTSIPVQIMNCPSDPASDRSLLSGPTGPNPTSYPCGTLYPSSYLGMGGSNDLNTTGTYSGCISGMSNGNGMFYSNSATRFASVLDGTSQTVMFGERGIPADLGWGWPIAGGTECEQYVSSTLGVFAGNYNPPEYFIHTQHYWSWHPGGVQVTMADGSTRFLAYTTDYQTYLAITTRHGGEVVGEF